MKEKVFTIDVQMLIWKPVAEVFNAFIDPTITTNFWFTKSSGPLEAGKTVIWGWEAGEVSARIIVEEIIENELIRFDWGDPIPKVEIEFRPYGDSATLVMIRNYSEELTVGGIINEIIDSTSNLTSVLDGLKIYLEHDIRMNLIGDKFPHHHRKTLFHVITQLWR